MTLQILGIDLPTELFTPQSIYTTGFMAAGTFAACNSMQLAFNFNPRWFGLLFAQVLVFVLHLTLTSGPHFDVAGILVSFVNGCIIYLTAGGATSMLGTLLGHQEAQNSVDELPVPTTTGQLTARKFVSPWF